MFREALTEEEKKAVLERKFLAKEMYHYETVTLPMYKERIDKYLSKYKSLLYATFYDANLKLARENPSSNFLRRWNWSMVYYADSTGVTAVGSHNAIYNKKLGEMKGRKLRQYKWGYYFIVDDDGNLNYYKDKIKYNRENYTMSDYGFYFEKQIDVNFMPIDIELFVRMKKKRLEVERILYGYGRDASHVIPEKIKNIISSEINNMVDDKDKRIK